MLAMLMIPHRAAPVGITNSTVLLAPLVCGQSELLQEFIRRAGNSRELSKELQQVPTLTARARLCRQLLALPHRAGTPSPLAGKFIPGDT
jgi:hypothetical protein